MLLLLLQLFNSNKKKITSMALVFFCQSKCWLSFSHSNVASLNFFELN